ncbi:MAG: cobalt-precorrin 5A hydrolase [Firmicutes bacterium]|nr:cobalt-precorrin 5A hydrolase [Bacillota bacterium]
MKPRIFSFTKKGSALAKKLSAALWEDAECFAPEGKGDKGTKILDSLQELTREAFEMKLPLIFIGAAGIAVRAIAPYVKNKTSDPAVLVLDENGKFVIPLLSGHLGGGNELAGLIAKALGATPVITTATDINGLFSVDVFAKKNSLYITDMTLAKKISAALLDGEEIGFCSELPVLDAIPEGLGGKNARLDILVSSQKEPVSENTLLLIPKRITVGMGCKKGKSAAELEDFLLENLNVLGIKKEELFCIASIDLKKEEKGLLELSEKLSVPFRVFSAKELMAAEGEFSYSKAVMQRTGVDCVCERAAICAGANRLIYKKHIKDGMTLAIAKFEEGLRFGQDIYSGDGSRKL